MSGSAADPPSPDRLAGVFSVSSVRRMDGTVQYIGDPLVPPAAAVEQLRPVFRQRGYDVRLEELGPESGDAAATTSNGGTPIVGGQSVDDSITAAGGPLNARPNRYALVAEPADTGTGGVPWLNIGLLLATIASTLYVGASAWYYIPVAEDPLRVFEAWPFVVAMLGVLGIHELGHYAAARYHGVDVTLPYFIPFPSYLGTMGAVINIRGRIPDRRALFDIGVAGPLAGLVATVVVTAIGVTLPPVEVTRGIVTNIELGYPLLLQGIAAVMGEQLEYANPQLLPNPVVIGGWVGAFVTFLNLLPVGQLDGSHVARSLFGDRLSLVQLAVPVALFGLAGYLVAFEGGRAAGLWAFWGILALVFGRLGSATPLDETPLGPGRWAVGLLTFVLGMLCFVPVPLVITM